MNKKIWIIFIIIVILAIIAIWYGMRKTPATAPSSEQPSAAAPQNVQAPSDTTSSINNDLQSVDTSSPDQNFQSIDTNLNSL